MRILLVDNGSSLSGSNLGNKIDEFDVVIRVNDANIYGYENDVGTRRDIWCTYNPEKKFDKFFRYQQSKSITMEQIQKDMGNVKEVWYVAPKQELLKGWNYRRLRILNKNILCRHLGEEKLKEILSKFNHPTTGLILIDILLTMYDKIHICGFDFGNDRDKSLKKHQYFSDRSIEDGTKNTPHDTKREMDYVYNLIFQNKVIYLNKDIEIKDSFYIGITKNLMCESCGYNNIMYDWENSICHKCESNI